MPSSDTLRAWRVAADKLAKAIGAPFACNLCKRPIKTAERFGRLTMRPPKAWRGRLFERKICHSCYIAMKSLIEELEMLGARDHLPPENYTDVEDAVIEEKEINAVLPLRNAEETS